MEREQRERVIAAMLAGRGSSIDYDRGVAAALVAIGWSSHQVGVVFAEALRREEAEDGVTAEDGGEVSQLMRPESRSWDA